MSASSQQELRLADTFRQRVAQLEEESRKHQDTAQQLRTENTELIRHIEKQHRDALAVIDQWRKDGEQLQQRAEALERDTQVKADRIATLEEENRTLNRLTAQQTVSLANLQDHSRTAASTAEAHLQEIKDLQERLRIAEKDAYQAHQLRESREGREQQLEEELRQIKASFHQTETHKTRLEQALHTKEEEIRKWENDCRELMELNQSFRSQLHASSQSASISVENATKIVTQLEEASLQLSATRRELDEANHRLHVSGNLVSELQAQKQLHLRELDHLREEVQMSDQAAENLLVAHEDLKTTLATEISKHKETQEQLAALTTELATMKKQYDDLESDNIEHLDTIEGFKRRVGALQDALEGDQKTLSELDIRISEVTSEKEMQCFRFLELERNFEALQAEYTAHKANAMAVSEMLMELQNTHEKLTATAETDSAEVSRLRELLTETRAQLAATTHDVEALTSEKASLSAERDQLHANLASLEERFNLSEAALTDAKSSLETLTQQQVDALAQIASLTTAHETLTNECEQLTARNAELSTQLATETAAADNWSRQHQSLLQEMEAANQAMQEDVEMFREARAELLHDNETLKDKLAKAQEELEQTTQQRDAAMTQNKLGDLELQAAQKDIADLEKTRETLLQKQQQQLSENLKLQERGVDLESARSTALRQLAEVKKELEHLRDQHKQAKYQHEKSTVALERAAADLRERLENESVSRERAEDERDSLQLTMERLTQENAHLTEAKGSLSSIIDELKLRVNSDTEKINTLLESRRASNAERDLLVQKYNLLFDQHKALRKQQNPNVSIMNTSIGTDTVLQMAEQQQAQQRALLRNAQLQIQNLCATCQEQETELVQLRQHNQILQSSVGKFLNASTVAVEDLLHDKNITVHALNTEEGPRRMPQRRRPTVHVRDPNTSSSSSSSSFSQEERTDNGATTTMGGMKRRRDGIVPLGEQPVNR